MHGINVCYGWNQGKRSEARCPRSATARLFFRGRAARRECRLGKRLASLNMTDNKRGQLRFRQRAHFGRFDSPVLEDHERGYAAYPVLGRRALVLVDVELRDLEPAGVFLRDLVEYGRDHFAGATPFGPV